MEAPAYYKPLTEKIINVCGTEWGATKKAMREAMRKVLKELVSVPPKT